MQPMKRTTAQKRTPQSGSPSALPTIAERGAETSEHALDHQLQLLENLELQQPDDPTQPR